MNELRRVAYLEAMGIDSYVSRRQLPGAAETRRLAIATPRPPAPTPASAPAPLGEMRERLAPATKGRPGSGGLAGDGRPASPEPAAAAGRTTLSRFSLSAIVAGRWLWLEELGEMPLAVEQVHLVEAMARALLRAGATGDGGPAAMAAPEVTQFDWPIHTNRQLDLGEEAARAAVAGFVSRRLERCEGAGLVLLGDPCVARVPLEEIGAPVVRIPASLEILADPALKPRVWRDLVPFAGAS